ncbi:cytochrome P450 [Mycena filopes]|nr:cytochrome P450 [Mycena filopes]
MTLTLLQALDQPGIVKLLVGLAGIWIISRIRRRLATHKSLETRLDGPPADSFIFGMSRQMAQASDGSLLFQAWATEYGPVFWLPTAFGGHKTILCDPKAVNYFYSMERSVYVKSKLGRAVIANLFGKGLLWAEGEDHKRQRKALTPAFSNAAIRRLTAIFYDSVYKLKASWDTAIDSSPDDAIIDVEHWLDSISLAGFSHNFGTLDGQYSPVAAAFEALSFEGQSTLSVVLFMLGTRLPFLVHLPFERNRIIGKLRREMSRIAVALLEKTRREKRSGVADEAGDRSIIGLLLKAEEEDAELHMNEAEVMAQNVLLVAGYETTSGVEPYCTSVVINKRETNPQISQWALIELAKQPDKQAKLRAELIQFGAAHGDPTWDQLASNTHLPYLDAVVLEVLRLHPPVTETTREAIVDDVLPLSQPLSGGRGSVLALPKGSIVTVPIRYLNRSEALWGPTAKRFEPERWFTLKDDPVRAKELAGHHHLLTFLDGPRTCLGKGFALGRCFFAVLSVLVRNFRFEFPGGPRTEITRHRGLVPRPKVVGEAGARVPMKVMRVE